MELNLGHCVIGADGAEIVAEFLKHDETVRKVWINDCRLGSRGAKAIAESLKHNWTVELLILYSNPIGDVGAEALLDALNHNVCIKAIRVFNNSVSPKFLATIKYLTRIRNAILIPAAVRCASLSLIAARRNIINAGTLAIFPKEIVKMIAMEVWATRKDPIWINALTESERTGESGD